jgi:phosphoglycolate phosphatase
MDILVDLDGTLIDPKPGLIGSVQYALRKLGLAVPPAEELLWLIGRRSASPSPSCSVDPT